MSEPFFKPEDFAGSPTIGEACDEEREEMARIANAKRDAEIERLREELTSKDAGYVNAMDKENERLSADNARLREALERFANGELGRISTSEAERIARAALGASEER